MTQENPLEKEIREADNKLRMARLAKTERQRWIPLVGTYRLLKDTWTGDFGLLDQMHSKVYQLSNAVYNTLTPGGIILGAGLIIKELMEK